MAFIVKPAPGRITSPVAPRWRYRLAVDGRMVDRGDCGLTVSFQARAQLEALEVRASLKTRHGAQEAAAPYYVYPDFPAF